MRYKTILAAFVAVVALACSCAKDGTGKFEGNYSFKMSGVIDARKVAVNEPADEAASTGGLLPDEVSLKITTESGQMDVTPVSGEEMLVTMNIIGGDIVVMHADVDGSELVLRPKERHMLVSFTSGEGESGSVKIESELTMSGRGQIYDNILLFSIDYQGSFEVGGTKYEIVGSDVDCRAKLNE